MENRRDFLVKLAKSGLLIGMYPLVQSCTKGGLSPFETYRIDEILCNGCNSCVTMCKKSAILLPQPTTYRILAEKCTECGKCVSACVHSAIEMASREYYIEKNRCTECGDCVPVCPQNAFRIMRSDYHLEEDKCVGCGKCIEVCPIDGNCFTYEKSEYSVRSKCRNKDCGRECIAICPLGAITRVGGIAVIDMYKCDRCGKCVAVCPHDAINPAKVTLDESRCTDCGKCFGVCTFHAIEKEVPEGYVEPHIDGTICDRCGECLNVCNEKAIAFNQNGNYTGEPRIVQEKCTHCGDCYPVCTSELAINRELKTAVIDDLKCVVCGDCIPFCKPKAILRG